METREDFYYYKVLKALGISYLGAVSQSAKMVLSEKRGTLTYCLYLAPANMSGYDVCPNSKHCREFCLNGSGRNKGDVLKNGFDGSHINRSRIKKTRLFFEKRELFMLLLIYEIARSKRRAERLGMRFAVRLNGTSDISPEEFVLGDKNVLEIFDDVQFYDYTKVRSRFPLMEKYPNYRLTYSYNGYNMGSCMEFLGMGGNVAVVFYNDKNLPKSFGGYKVIDGNISDERFLDERGTIVGLHYHRTANDYKSGKFERPNTKFIVFDDDERIDWGKTA